MLSLSRKTEQGIVLQTSDGPVLIRFKLPAGVRVHVGVEAPKAVKVLREEVAERDEAAAA